MRHRTAIVFALGLIFASAAQARDIVSDDVVGMACDEGNAGTLADEGYSVYYCDGRNWIRTGSI